MNGDSVIETHLSLKSFLKDMQWGRNFNHSPKCSDSKGCNKSEDIDEDMTSHVLDKYSSVINKNNATSKRDRLSARNAQAQDKSPSDELHPRKRRSCIDATIGSPQDKPEIQQSTKGQLRAEELTWTVKPTKANTGYNPAPTEEEMRILYNLQHGSTYENNPRYPDLIIGAEIAVLQKQQSALVSTISRLAGPKTLVLLTADDVPAYPAKSKYERNLDKSLREAGFLKIVLCADA